MDIILTDLSKRFERNMVLKKCNYHFQSQKIYGIRGSNGSGKSTLLKIISGYLSHSYGTVNYRLGDNEIERAEVFKYLCFSAPYIDLVEDFNLREMYDYHKSFKTMSTSNQKEFRSLLDYDIIKTDKFIRNYSSGMKNRVKLALSILSKSEVLILDEPSSFLDEAGVEWFIDLLSKHRENKMILIASNDKRDFALCDTVFNIQDIQS
jgi:ABC-type multidrug transport system ATPase subunit